MWKRILGWVILALLVAYVIFAAIWAHAESAKDACKGIDVEIVKGSVTDSVSMRSVMADIRSYPEKLIGTQLQRIDTRKLAHYLKESPQYEDVECAVTTDGRLKVKVRPMVPELRVFEDTVSYYINKDGKRMMSKATFFVDVPVVSGKFTSSLPPTYVLPVTRFIAGDAFLKNLVGMVRVEDHDNILLIPRIHGHVVNFGDTTRLEEKKKALLALYRQVLPYKGWEEYDTISVKFKGQVVATRRQKGSKWKIEDLYDDTDMEEATLPDIEYTENKIDE